MDTIDTLAAVVRTNARIRPDQPAITYEGRTQTYAELERPRRPRRPGAARGGRAAG